ncbi:hypothetical protein HanIR_Chr09g0436131 [Helianthus annuus]|nr:hypothetical protein HanIR_Chr09g0436131 [Helianthus annuus]
MSRSYKFKNTINSKPHFLIHCSFALPHLNFSIGVLPSFWRPPNLVIFYPRTQVSVLSSLVYLFKPF